MRTLSNALRLAALLAPLMAASHAGAAGHNATVDFSSGTQGWEGHWDGIYSNIDTTLGNAAPAYRTQFETFAITYVNSTNPDFIGDFTQTKSVSFGLDINVLSMSLTDTDPGFDPDRHLVLELRDYDTAAEGMPYASVWIDLGKLDIAQGWQHLQATIADTQALTPSGGWHGNGAENEFGEPVLPAGVTFAQVLKGVDQIAFTSFVPGYAYTAIDFDVAIDNVSVSAVPEPGSWALLAGGLAIVGGAARRRR